MTIPSVAARRFMVGRYQIVASPISGSAQMLRYTVFLHGVRVGALVSVPTESDCRHLESPAPVPPLKQHYYTLRPGRPRKPGAANAASASEPAA